MKKIVDIDLGRLPTGTKVKIVDKWRKHNGLQNPDGEMYFYFRDILIISEKYCGGYTCINAAKWIWYPEMFQAVQLPDSDVWYRVDYDNINNKYVVTLDEDVDIKPEEVISAKEPESKYMVYVSGKASPKKVHNTYESACQEAQRLAGKEVGYVVSVCKIEKQFIGKVIVEEIE